MSPPLKPRNAGRRSRQRRFGAFSGVFLPSLLSILGIILYLRLGWVVGSAGLGGALQILIAAHLISGITSLSLASIATGRTVGVGGAYFLVSRALGAPAGIAVGVPLFLAQTVSVGFYLLGFGQVLAFLAPGLDPRLSASLALGVLALFTLTSTDLGVRLQYPVFAAILLSLLSLYLGSAPHATHPPVDLTTAPGAGEAGSLMAVFAVFFPAVTGVMAGVGMSGDLRDPRRDLPLGVLAAVAGGFVVYASLMPLFAWRGDPGALVGDPFIAWEIARFPSLITLGVLAAALSSALGGLLAGPRTLQAIAADGFAPRRLGATQGRTGEPRLALAASLVLAETAILIGDLNRVAGLLTLFFLVAYAAVNLVCALETWAANPGFRPGFRLPWPVSLLGAVLCIAAMAAIHLPSMLLSLVLAAGLYLWAGRRHSRARFGDDRFGIMAAAVRTALSRLQRVPASPGGWRPNLLVFSEETPRRSFMLRMADAIVSDSGVVSLFHLLPGEVARQGAAARELEGRLQEALNRRFAAIFCRVVVVKSPFAAIPPSAQAYGVGRFAANTVMLGWPQRPAHRQAFFQTWQDLLRLGKSVIVVHHEPDRHAEHPRRLDLWWLGGLGNGAMLVLLGYLLARHEGERDCQLRLLAATRSPVRRQEAGQALEQMAQQAHAPLETRVFDLGSTTLEACITEHSRASDLVMLGVHPPGDPQQWREFMDRQARLLDALPTTLLVSSPKAFAGRETLFEDEATADATDSR